MLVSRRDFLNYCLSSAAAIPLSKLDLKLLGENLRGTGVPDVLWLHGSGCTGCSISFLNRFATSTPKSAADVVLSSINLCYHPNLMAAAGDLAVSVLKSAYEKGGFVLVVEGGVPTAFGGAACFAYTYQGRDVTFLEAVRQLSTKASTVISIGSCASYGGIPKAGPNPTGIVSVSSAIGKPTLNLPGCPVHPDWVVWAIVQLINGAAIPLDTLGRPTALYGSTVHSRCPRKEKGEASNFGLDGYCLEEIGCRGPSTKSSCPSMLWNSRSSWCIGANAPCYGCTEPSFPASPLWQRED